MPCPATHPSPRGIRHFRRSRYFGILLGKPCGGGILQPRAQWKHWERVLGLRVFLLSAGWAGNFGPNRHQGWKGKVLRNFWQAVGKIPPESLGIIEFSLEFSASRKLESPRNGCGKGCSEKQSASLAAQKAVLHGGTWGEEFFCQEVLSCPGGCWAATCGQSKLSVPTGR